MSDTKLPPMGIGSIGGNNPMFIRKWRWTFEADFPAGKVEPLFVKLAHRPQVDIESNNTIPHQKGEFTTTVFDFNETQSPELYKIFADLYQFGVEYFSTDGVPLEAVAPKLGTAKLKLYDGLGVLLETWELGQVFMTSINFGDLCYSSSEETTLEVTWRYGSCKYINEIPPHTMVGTHGTP